MVKMNISNGNLLLDAFFQDSLHNMISIPIQFRLDLDASLFSSVHHYGTGDFDGESYPFVENLLIQELCNSRISRHQVSGLERVAYRIISHFHSPECQVPHFVHLVVLESAILSDPFSPLGRIIFIRDWK